jgi:hypothetical protein
VSHKRPFLIHYASLAGFWEPCHKRFRGTAVALRPLVLLGARGGVTLELDPACAIAPSLREKRDNCCNILFGLLFHLQAYPDRAVLSS